MSYADPVPRIESLTFAALNVPLLEPFGIAQGAQLVAENVLCRLTLEDGTLGLGEAAPFPAVNGETQAQVLEALPGAATALQGRPIEWLKPLSKLARDLLAHAPSALCAVETALLDAHCRHLGSSLFSFFGGAEPSLTTDLTVPTGSIESARRAAERAWKNGFSTLKIKVGGAPLDLDLGRVLAVAEAAPGARLLLDANASLSSDQALELLSALGAARAAVALFEQPTPAQSLDELARVKELGGIPVAADESARSVHDVLEIARRSAADVINVKITKTGLFEALDMVAAARAHGLGLMIGGMVETELCMTTSASLAAGIGGFSFVDLDTPLFMAERPLVGGFAQEGPLLRVDATGPGHGVREMAPRRAEPAIVTRT